MLLRWIEFYLRCWKYSKIIQPPCWTADLRVWGHYSLSDWLDKEIFYNHSASVDMRLLVLFNGSWFSSSLSLSLSDPVQVCFRRSVWVSHAGERPKGVPETSAPQTVSVFVPAQGLCSPHWILLPSHCVCFFPHAYLHPFSLLCLFLSCSTVDDCPPNQKVSSRERGLVDERKYWLHPCCLTPSAKSMN